MSCVAGTKTPRASGKRNLEKNGAAASGLRRAKERRPHFKKRAMSKTPNKNPLASQSRQRLNSGGADFWPGGCSGGRRLGGGREAGQPGAEDERPEVRLTNGAASEGGLARRMRFGLPSPCQPALTPGGASVLGCFGLVQTGSNLFCPAVGPLANG